MGGMRPTPTLVWIIAVAFYIPLLMGGMCAATRAPASAKPEAPAVPAPPDPNEKLLKAIEQAKTDAATAQAKGDRLAQLEAEKREADARAEQALHEAGEWQAYSKDKDVEITKERDHERQVKLYWFSGIMMLAALLAVGLSVWIPATAKWAVRFAIAAGVVAAVALVLAWLVPYLIWVGGAIVVAGLVAAGIWWSRDHKSLHQVVEAVGEAKNTIPAFKAAYKDVFTKVIDSDAEAHITAVRKRIGARRSKAEQQIAALTPPLV